MLRYAPRGEAAEGFDVNEINLSDEVAKEKPMTPGSLAQSR